MGVREPAVAGQFYPHEAEVLGGTVTACLADAPKFAVTPKAMVAPHAGYVYSGPVAGTAYATLKPLAKSIRRVVLLGPAHRVALRGFAVASADAFATPLGNVPVDWPALAPVLRMDDVGVADEAFAGEHSLEVHLPFLQMVLDDFSLVPILVGEASAEQVERLVAALWGGPETLIVVSSDLSHYHDYDTARKFDSAACGAVEKLRPDLLKDHQACGRRPIKGLLRRARALDLRATTLDLRNSGDTAGPRDRVVGYASCVFEYGGLARLTDEQRGQLLTVASVAIASELEGKGPYRMDLAEIERPLLAMRATFVTLKLDGKLRGCVGSLVPNAPLIVDVAQNACKAAFADRRFSRLTQDEFARAQIGISILSTPRTVRFASEAELAAQLRPDRDGVILEEGDKRGTFLPQVWESIPQSQDFLARLKAKAGLDANYWSDKIRAWRFSSESFGGG